MEPLGTSEGAGNVTCIRRWPQICHVWCLHLTAASFRFPLSWAGGGHICPGGHGIPSLVQLVRTLRSGAPGVWTQALGPAAMGSRPASAWWGAVRRATSRAGGELTVRLATHCPVPPSAPGASGACAHPVPACLNKRPRLSETPVVSPLQLPLLGVGWVRGRAAPGALAGWLWSLHCSPVHSTEGLGPFHVTGICTSSPLASYTACLPPAAAWARSFWNMGEYSGTGF